MSHLRGMGELSTSDVSLIEQFKTKAREFINALDALTSKADVAATAPPEIRAAYQKLVDRGLMIQSAVESATRMVDDVIGFFRTTFGFSGLNAVPVAVPYAVMAASAAAMTYFIADAVQMMRKLELVDEGKISQGTLVDLDQSAVDRFAGSAGTIAMLALVAGAAYLYWKNDRSAA